MIFRLVLNATTKSKEKTNSAIETPSEQIYYYYYQSQSLLSVLLRKLKKIESLRKTKKKKFLKHQLLTKKIDFKKLNLKFRICAYAEN